jgi:hypothetical protein
MPKNCPTKKIVFKTKQAEENFQAALHDQLELVLSEGIPSSNGIQRKCQLLENEDIVVSAYTDLGHMPSLDITIPKSDATLGEVSKNDVCCI